MPSISFDDFERLKKRAKEVALTCRDDPNWAPRISIEVATSSGFRRAKAWLFANESLGVTHYGNLVAPVRDGEQAQALSRWRHLKTLESLTEHTYISSEQLMAVECGLDDILRRRSLTT